MRLAASPGHLGLRDLGTSLSHTERLPGPEPLSYSFQNVPHRPPTPSVVPAISMDVHELFQSFLGTAP